MPVVGVPGQSGTPFFESAPVLFVSRRRHTFCTSDTHHTLLIASYNTPMKETLTLAHLHVLAAAAPSTAPVTVEVDGRAYQMFELEITAGRAVLVIDQRPAPWEFTAADFADLLHNEFYTTPAVMSVFVRDLLGREFAVMSELRLITGGVAVQAGGQPIQAPAQVAELYASSRTRARIARG